LLRRAIIGGTQWLLYDPHRRDLGMLRLETNRGVQSCDGLTRRDFLRAGSLAVGLSLAEWTRLQALGAAPKNEKASIQLFLVGGPSQLETWDPKPLAPSDIRGPFRPIATNVPGITISEHFPHLAQRMDRVAILRSVYHPEAPIHETGHQLLQTGALARDGVEWPHYGAALSKLRPTTGDVPPWVIVPGPIGNTGVSVGHGQGAGYLGERFEPMYASPEMRRDVAVRDPIAPHGLDPARLDCRSALVDAVEAVERAVETTGDSSQSEALQALVSPPAKQAFNLSAESDTVRTRYGWNTFGQSCLLARRLVQHGVGLVTVNMFDTVFGQTTWDCHANGGDLSSTLDDYKTTLCPMFDTAYAALLDDLEAMGLLENTLVVSMGEFGRTPVLNHRGGRDHWPGVWSMLMAGGGVRGGQVIGASDRHAAEPADRPIHASEIAATIYHALDIDGTVRLPAAGGQLLPVVHAKPVAELF
jgi:uncharacterized protein (DUF1501 family)